MKKLIFVFVLIAAVLGVNANTLTLTNVKTEIKLSDEKKVEIKADSLSEKITKSIAETKPESKISKAFKLVNEAGTVTGYEVVLLTGTKEETLAFDAEGEPVKK